MDTSIKGYIFRFFKLLFGFSVAAFGISLTVKAGLGLSPWDVFSQGVALKATQILGVEIMLGTVIQAVGLIVLVAVIFLKETIGVGTIMDIIVYGYVFNLIEKSGIIPTPETFAVKFIFLILGFFIWSIGVYTYMSVGLGAGPRDSLMAALAKRNVPISLAKNSIEFVVFVTGWALGGKVGLGTVVAVFTMGYMLKFVFTVFKFDIMTVHNDSVIETFSNIKKSFTKVTE